MLTSGRNISAGEAQRMGLVQEITEPDQLMERVHELAGAILAVGPDAVKKVKSVIRKSASMSLTAGYELESNEFGTLFEGEGEEGMKAFLEKRKPAW
jgi:enoyl-CoA hydratase